MSTVALRGNISYDETTKEWSWSGRWVFGDCVPVPVNTDASSSHLTEGDKIIESGTSKAKSNQYKKHIVASQPFLYQWKEASDPSVVAVPSLNVDVISAAEEEGLGEGTADLATSTEQEANPLPLRTIEDSSTTPREESSTSDKIASVDENASEIKNQNELPSSAEVSKESSISETGIEYCGIEATSVETSSRKEGKTIISSTPIPTLPTTTGNIHIDDNTKKIVCNIEDKEKFDSKQSKRGTTIENPTPDIIAGEKSNDPLTVEVKSPIPAITNSEKTHSKEAAEKESLLEASKYERHLSENVENIDQQQVEIDRTINDEKEKLKELTTTRRITERNSDGEELKVKTAAPPKYTFSSVIPRFFDASKKYNCEKNEVIRCPSSGKWEGYFENVIPGKKSGRNRIHQPPQIQKVNETFYLFLNATPSSIKELTATIKNENDSSSNGSDTNSINKETGSCNTASENYPSANLFAFETTTKDHIPKIPIIKLTKESIQMETGTTSASIDNCSADDRKRNISLVQVRGCGENEFGIFEIMGYLDLNTMVMEIQRQYVVAEVATVSSPAPTRRRRSLPNSAPVGEGPRPHSTRKRNPTWKRASYGPEDDRRRKRAKSLSAQKQTQESPKSIDPKADSAGFVSTSTQLFSTASIPFTVTSNQSKPLSKGILQGKAQSNPTPMPIRLLTIGDGPTPSSAISAALRRGSKSRLVLPVQTKPVAQPVSSSTTGVSGDRRRSSIGSNGGALRTKRRSSSIGKSITGPTSTKSGSTYIRLPPVGDPKNARWRAAHFLYYQRDDPEQHAQQQQQQQSQPGNSAFSSNIYTIITNVNKATTQKPKYVIYEGEMVDSKREGRGICLYNDGNVYEGEWKRNKEHGYGKVMMSDRKKIIYEGEWERGRMQGTGTYYYGSSDPNHPGPRYTGEFRENLRNGIGRYFLPDGSVYDGQWRDGVMNGLGVFTWPDKSMYDGVWKDGKRNGQGLLKKADGFVYDGQWVNNTMEGRGSAIYPNGQRYEGSFSNGRREGRGTIIFTNGAVYEGRFRDDAVDGQGTMKMSRTMIVPRENKSQSDKLVRKETKDAADGDEEKRKADFMIPISFQSDMTRILTKTGFM